MGVYQTIIVIVWQGSAGLRVGQCWRRPGRAGQRWAVCRAALAAATQGRVALGSVQGSAGQRAGQRWRRPGRAGRRWAACRAALAVARQGRAVLGSVQGSVSGGQTRQGSAGQRAGQRWQRPSRAEQCWAALGQAVQGAGAGRAGR
ncbi:unnamed protein product [Closterium sp. NIES-64]|nr:unnamed protein product [Closterium sp. NIES-64]